jgi:hypothetical protein
VRYTLAVTSCGRHDLLEQTLASFCDTADLPPWRTIIVEDGPLEMPASIRRMHRLGQIEWITNDVRMGQSYSLDRLYSEIKTEYVFHCEDDWLFHTDGFIRPSFDILEKHPNISMVALRSDWNHPLIKDPAFSFNIAEPYWGGVWGGTCWNPGMRRLSDYHRYGSYGKHVTYGTHGLGHEKQWSKMHLDDGYRIAVLPKHCHHIGANRSKSIEPLELKIPKLLIAILACHEKNYSKWESENSPRYRAADNFNEKPYGTDIHISGSEDPGVQAVRDTWAKDVEAFKSHVDLRFFYGTPHPRQPLADEVFLSCPDDYGSLPKKTIALNRWSLENDYDYTFKCDSDTYVYVDRLVRELLTTRFDYAGWCQGLVCSGGTGYFTSKRASRYIATYAPHHWAEDVTVGQCMDVANIKPVHLPQHRPGFAAHWYFPNGFEPRPELSQVVTAHAVQPEVMRAWHEFTHPRSVLRSV